MKGISSHLGSKQASGVSTKRSMHPLDVKIKSEYFSVSEDQGVLPKIIGIREFPGGPVVRTLSFHRFNPWSGS